MKKLLMIAGLATCATPALAADQTITVPDTFKVTMQQTQAAFERCLGATVAHINTDQCNAVANVLGQLATLQPSTTAPPSPPQVPASPVETPASKQPN